MSHGNFFWYDLVSKDPTASRAFLTKLFGWVAADASMPDGTHYTSFSSGGNLICGLIPLGETRDYDAGRAHWMSYLQVDRLFSTIARAERSGGEILSEAMPVPDLGSYQVVRDPDGAMLSLVEARHPVLSPGFSWHSVVWNELLCRRSRACSEFYRAVAGWNFQTSESKLDYGFFTVNGQNMAGLLEVPGSDFGDLRPGWQTYIAVENVDSVTDKVEQCGGHVAVAPFDLTGVGRMAIIIEPGECVINLLTPPA